MFIYFDTCCLNRPYDDQSQPRIQLEAAAVLAILERVTAGDVQLASSSVLQFEIHRIADQTRRKASSTSSATHHHTSLSRPRSSNAASG